MKNKSILLAALLLTLIQVNTFACRCSFQSIEAGLASADRIFVGKVMRVEHKIGQNIVTVRVAKYIKGGSWFWWFETLRLGQSSCDIKFVEGKDYVIYTRKLGDGKLLTTNLCSRTTTHVQHEMAQIVATKK